MQLQGYSYLILRRLHDFPPPAPRCSICITCTTMPVLECWLGNQPGPQRLILALILSPAMLWHVPHQWRLYCMLRGGRGWVGILKEVGKNIRMSWYAAMSSGPLASSEICQPFSWHISKERNREGDFSLSPSTNHLLCQLTYSSAGSGCSRRPLMLLLRNSYQWCTTMDSVQLPEIIW